MTTVNKTTTVLFLVVVFAAGAALYHTFFDRPPIVLGFVGNLTGKGADLGVDCRRGTELAIVHANRNGGVNGRMVELQAVDDGQNEEQATEAVRGLLAQALPAIIGHTTSAMSLATLPLVDGSSTLMVSPTTSTPLLQDRDDNFIRSCVVASAAAASMARYLRREAGVRRAGVVYDVGNKAYTGQWYENFSRTFLEEGGETVEGFTFTSESDAGLFSLVKEMRGRDMDVLVIVANSVDGAMLCQQVRKIGWAVPLALADWAATERLIDLGGEAVENVIISQFFNRMSDKPEYVQFKREFVESYKSEPGFGALHAYNATKMVLESMARQESGESLKQAILRISRFQGLQDDIVINRFGDSNHPTYIGVILNGKFDLIGVYR